MTVSADPQHRRSLPAHDALSEERALTRISDLLVTRADDGTWWTAIARSVDDLIDLMSWDQEPEDEPGGRVGLLEDQAHHAVQVRRSEQDHAELVDAARRLRSLIAVSAGRPGGVSAVLASATETVALIRGSQRRAPIRPPGARAR